MGKLGTLLALDRHDRVATFEALFALTVAQVLVRIVPPRKWRDRFGPSSSLSASGAIGRDQLEPVRRVRFAIARAARNLPTEPNCLPQALAARRMLGRRGIESTLFIGAERDEQGKAHFHAWLKVGSEWVTGLCDEERYALLLPDGSEAA
ncbi:lasso peptide biosynthesis B2 protein [Qipengyuania sp. 902]|uniref:lasso peptide biosynthesis B2 protein n=1 Tax=Qipengyuania sp. 902 TaxID=3417565 RepID=UPI003EBEA5B7